MSLFKKQPPPQPLTTDNILVLNTANTFEIDDFEVFTLAYEAWFGKTATFKEIEPCYASYKLEGRVPHWVRSYCRNIVSLDTVKAISTFVDTDDLTGKVLRQLILGLCVILSSLIIMNTF